MRKIVLNMFFILIVMNLFLCTYGLRNSNKGYESKYNTHGEPQNPKALSSSTSDINENTTTRRGLGLSAWGIVTVVVSFILAVAGMYYFSICYPVLCKKNRKYDIMGLTPA